MQGGAGEQSLLDLMDRTASDRLIDAPRQSQMEVGPVLPPVLAGHEPSVLQGKLGRPSRFDLPPLVRLSDRPHFLKRWRRHAAGPLAVFRLEGC